MKYLNLRDLGRQITEIRVIAQLWLAYRFSAPTAVLAIALLEHAAWRRYALYRTPSVHDVTLPFYTA